MASKDFEKLFLDREFETIKGENNRSIRLLTIILLVTFIALAHVLGGYLVLKDSMDNPYTNWLRVPKRMGNAEKFVNFEAESQEIKKKYDIKSITKYTEPPMFMNYGDLTDARFFTCRNVSKDDKIFDVVKDPKNIIQRFSISYEDCGIIISNNALQNKLGLPSLQDGEYLAMDRFNTRILMPVSMIVKKLPNDVDMVVSDELMTLLENGSNVRYYDSNVSSRFYIAVNDKRLNQGLKAIEAEGYEVEKNEAIKVNGLDMHVVKVFTDDRLVHTERMSLAKELEKIEGVISYIPTACVDVKAQFDPDMYSLNFSKLSKIRELQNYLYSIGIPVSTYDVESKYNFYIVSAIAILFILLLVLFSSFSIILFINNIVKNHLEKIKPNLGTLKAFGLSEKNIDKEYSGILQRFFLKSSGMALIAYVLYGLLMKFVFTSVPFKMIHWSHLLIWLLIFFVTILFFKKMIKEILFKSPGDLIYNR